MIRWKSPKGEYLKKLLSVTFAALLCTAGLFSSTLFTSAADKVDLKTACSLTIKATSSTDPYYLEDLAKADVVMDIYKVADAKEAKDGEGYTFEVIDPYAGLITIPDNTDLKTWRGLSQEATGVIRTYYEAGNPIKPDCTVPAGAYVRELEAGLYIVLARGEGIEDYFMEEEVKDTDEQGKEITEKQLFTLADGYEFSYKFEPEFVALPTKEPDPLTGEINIYSDGDWLYNTSVYMKPSAEPRFGDIKIIKDLISYEKSEPAFFVFSVEAVKKYGDEERNVFSNVYTMKFTDAKEDYLIVKDIPVGAEVTVTEVYSGATYTVTSQPYLGATIIANDIVDLRFINEYVGDERHCGAITNHFEPVLDENGNVVLDKNGQPTYTWSKYGDSREEDFD